MAAGLPKVKDSQRSHKIISTIQFHPSAFPIPCSDFSFGVRISDG